MALAALALMVFGAYDSYPHNSFALWILMLSRIKCPKTQKLERFS